MTCSLFQTERSALFVAEENGVILGCCGIFPTENLPENTTELVKFYLTKEARGKGIGKLLMQKCIEKAKELGYQQVYLKVCRNSAKLFPFMKNKDFSIWKKLWEIPDILVAIFG
jgi:putative acetyltransferase